MPDQASTISLTAYHAKYFAYELTKCCPSDSLEKLAGALADAQISTRSTTVSTAGPAGITGAGSSRRWPRASRLLKK